MLDVPVLRIHAMPGDLIGEADVQWIRIEARRAGANTVTRLEELIGRTPRRPIAAGQAGRITDVRPNCAINRGAPVPIALRSGPMTITPHAEERKSGGWGKRVGVGK